MGKISKTLLHVTMGRNAATPLIQYKLFKMLTINCNTILLLPKIVNNYNLMQINENIYFQSFSRKFLFKMKKEVWQLAQKQLQNSTLLIYLLIAKPFLYWNY